MMRVVMLASIALGCGSCRPQEPSAPPRHASGASLPAKRVPPREPRSSSTLAEQHHAPVTIERSVRVPGGAVFVYAYGLLPSKVGASTAADGDVEAKLAAEQSRCEKARSGVAPPKAGDSAPAEPRSCEELAAAVVLEDENLTSACRAVGVASVDERGELLGSVELQGACLVGITSFEAYDLTQEPEDELMLVVSYESFGQLTHGGWGQTQQLTRLHVLSVGSGEGGLTEQLVVDLAVEDEGGTCNNGIRRSVRVAGEGVIEVFAQKWNGCDREKCIDPDDEAAEEADPGQICRGEPVTAERAAWRPEEAAWVFEPREFEGAVLPDGIMK
jgi:hypothetical protein